MPFVQLETWDARVGAAPLQTAGASQPSDLQHRLRRRALAALVSALAHLLLLWLLATRLTPGIEGAPDEGTAGGAVTLLDLAAPEAAPPAKAEAVSLPMPPTTQVAEVDSSAATELPPPEWSVSRMQIASPAISTATPARASVSAGAASGTAGAGAFDPYAGAAPLPIAPAELDEAALEEIRKRVGGAFPNARGTAALVVRVAGSGVVLEAAIRGGTAPAEAKEALRKAVTGTRLFEQSPDPVRTLDLPILQLN